MLCATSIYSNNSNEEVFAGITCPPDKWVDCDAEIWYLDTYGSAYFKDYSGKVFTLPKPEVHRHINDCNTGYIERVWKHKYGSQWFSCTQTIYVGEQSQKPTIYWPRDGLVLEGCSPNILPKNLPAYYDEPHYASGSCSNLIHTYKDQLFSISGGCKKIIRKWTVIDWCTYVPNAYPVKGYYEHYQTIKLINDEVPHAYETHEVEVKATSCSGAYVHVPDLTVGASDCDEGYKIINNSSYSDYKGANASGHYPVGMHTIHYTVEYGCGSSATFKQVIKVNNDLSPVPLCLSALSIALMPVDEDRDGVPEDGSVEIWAKDIDHKSYHPCGSDLTFSFDEAGEQQVLEFTCATVGFNELNLYVTDANGNQSFCRVGILVQNNAANIPNCTANDEGGQDEEPVDEMPQDTMVYDTSMVDVPLDTMHVDVPIDSSMLDSDTTHMDMPMDTTMMAMDSMGVDTMDYTMDMDTTSHEESDTSSMGMVFGSVLSIDGNAIESSSLLFEGPEVAGQTTIEMVVVPVVVDSFINEFGQQFYVTDFVTEERVVESAASVFSENVAVNSNGEYILTNVPMGQPVTIAASVDAGVHADRISTADGILLFEHLAGISRIEDPYRLLAADIDMDGDIDIDDVEFLVDYLAETTEALPAAEWLFADAAYTFSNPNSPWSEEFIASSVVLNEPIHNMDIVGIQIGDIGDIDLESRSDLQTLIRDIERFKGEFSSELQISPNPFTDEFNLSMDMETNGIATIQLFDMSGKLIRKQSLSLRKGANRQTIDLSDLNYNGSMIYQVTTEDQQYHGKLIRLR
jgi:hypothetical protein